VITRKGLAASSGLDGIERAGAIVEWSPIGRRNESGKREAEHLSLAVELRAG